MLAPGQCEALNRYACALRRDWHAMAMPAIRLGLLLAGMRVLVP